MSRILIIIISLLLSLMMSVVPLSEGLLQVNPAWCLLTLLFWTYIDPHKVNVGVAWCVGMVVDGLTGSILGMHAVSFLVVVYLFDLLYRRFHMYLVLQQSLMVGALVACNFLVFSLAAQMFMHVPIVWTDMLSVVTSAICWPFYRSFGRKLNFARS